MGDDDVVHHLKARFLAHGLHLAHKLPHEALVDQFGREADIQGHGAVAPGLGHKTFFLTGGDQYILRGEGYGHAVQLEGIIMALVMGRNHRVANAVFGKIGVDLGQELTVARPQGFELGLDAVGNEGGRVAHIFHQLYVELLADDAGEHGGQLLALHVHGGDGLAILDSCGIAGAAAQHHDGKHLVHVGLEVFIDVTFIHGRPIA